MKYDKVTWVLTKRIKYFFSRCFTEYNKTIAHSENCLTKLEIQSGFRKFSIFCSLVASISIDSIFNFAFKYYSTGEKPRKFKPMNLNQNLVRSY